MSYANQWAAFHRANPEVWRLFCQFTSELLATGHKRVSADAVLHRIRWETMIKTTGNAPNPGDPARPLKLNNNFSAYYGRLYNLYCPGVFETRSNVELPNDKG